MRAGAVLDFLAEYVRPARVRTVQPADVHARLGERGFHVFDCNMPAHYARGHVPGALHVAWDAPDPRLLPADRDATLVFYCASAL